MDIQEEAIVGIGKKDDKDNINKTMTRKNYRQKVRKLFNRELLGKNITSETGEGSKVMVVGDAAVSGGSGKIKQKGPWGKIKYKYGRDGELKKTVYRKGGKRRVVKPNRDSRKTFLNAIRNRRDERIANK